MPKVVLDVKVKCDECEHQFLENKDSDGTSVCPKCGCEESTVIGLEGATVYSVTDYAEELTYVRNQLVTLEESMQHPAVKKFSQDFQNLIIDVNDLQERMRKELCV